MMHKFIDIIKNHVHARANTIQIDSQLTPNTLPFCSAFNASKPTIIAEIKFASPSCGRLYHGTLDPVAIAGAYLSQGASALSILTEPVYFQGTIETIGLVRQAYPNAPILMKDFVISETQIAQGLAYGANAVLLIVAFLTPQKLRALYDYALELGLTPLIEVHDSAELDIALALNPKLIGINHRNLNTLTIDLDRSIDLIQSIPQDIIVIAESGIETKSAINEMIARGFHGCLIGSQLMKQEHPGEALHQLLRGDDDQH